MSDPSPPGASPPPAESRDPHGRDDHHERGGDDGTTRSGTDPGGRRPGNRPRGRRRGQASDADRTDRRQPHRSHPRRAFSPEQVAARAASLPTITYPEELPVSARRAEIARAIRENQVVIVSGETGSGKTTQIPKILLELGRGITGLIGHTQPRRIAARTVAERIAEEIGTPLGQVVGYQVRFTDVVSDATLVKLMTDGILLAEIQRDPLLTRYDTIVIDEAHERSLNIDFLLGYLSNLLPRRPDLKVIITSATIDSARFAAHFGPRTAAAVAARSAGRHDDAARPAPIVEVSGRTYPVEIRWRPLVPEEDGGDDLPEDVSRRGDRGDEGGRARRTPPRRTPDREDPLDQFTAICLAADELMAEGPGDILVFLSGEREITDAQTALAEHLGSRYVAPGQARGHAPNAVEILPLYARLTAAEQHRVFEPHTIRRIVLATNVAETSLTVPGVRYVIDPGTARISRFSTRTKVQRLPIEPISRASANQRSGRCGRVADGIAIRLYTAADYASRPEFTEPEILRTSLAAVILQMAALGLGDVARFPFVDPPDTRAIRDGVSLLVEIGALEDRGTTTAPSPRRNATAAAGGPTEGAPGRGPALTPVGRKLATLPIDPRLGRMLLEAGKNGCATEALIIVAALSVQDVRERPVEKQQQADQLHRRFTDPTSDFLAYLNLWRYLRTQQRDLSSSAFRRLCRAEFLNYLRVREWQDIVTQLRQLAKPLGLTMHPVALPKPAETAGASPAEVAAAVVALGRSADTPSADAVHQSLLVGLLSNLGNWDERRRDYAGARGTRFVIWPGSGLARKQYDWVMAAELVETSRLFARTVARIDPSWIEPAAAHLLKRTYSEPFWSARQGAAMVHEKLLLHGLTIVADRTVPLTRVGTAEAAELARELFLRQALVEGEWRTHHPFLAENRRLLEEAEELEERSRRRGLTITDQGLFDFYDERIPASVTSARHFDAWWKKARTEAPDLLTLTHELLLPGAGAVTPGDFPTTWTQGDLTLPLEYTFSPGDPDDGITVLVPVSVLARLRPDGFDWLVPGLLPELAVATIKALPKRTRVQLVPAPDTAAQVLRALPPWHEGAGGDGPTFTESFAEAVRRLRGVVIPPEEFDDDALPPHLRVTFRVVNDKGVTLARSKNLISLQRRLADQTRDAVRQVVRGAVTAAREDDAGRRGRGRGGRDATRPAGSAGIGTRAATPSFLEQPGVTDWPVLGDTPGTGAGDVLPATVTSTGPEGLEVRGYPALAVEKQAGAAVPRVSLRVMASAADQARAHADGVVRLALGKVSLGTERVTTRWTGADALTLAASPYATTAALVADIQLAAATALAREWATTHVRLEAVRTRADFDSLTSLLRDRLEDEVYRTVGVVVKVLAAWREADRVIRGATSLALLDVVADVRAQVSRLVCPGFIAATPPDRLNHLPRYLNAARVRVERAQGGAARADAANAWVVGTLEDDLEVAREATARMAPDPARDRTLAEVRWLIEELRVSLFAQQLGTPVKVSEKRIRKVLDAL
jgi:ATP-dependent helicase HrpA